MYKTALKIAFNIDGAAEKPDFQKLALPAVLIAGGAALLHGAIAAHPVQAAAQPVQLPGDPIKLSDFQMPQRAILNQAA